MESIRIGQSAVTTSRVSLGTWAIGGSMWGGTDEGEAIATIRSAVERGITLIDTAPAYGRGHSEEVVGKALAEGGLRERAQIATKVGLAWTDSKMFRDSRAPRIRQEIEDSLRRLRTDRIDLYQVHWPDLETPIEETAAELDALRREGKILAIGVSNFSPAQMDTFRAITTLDAVQPPYNLFERGIDADVLPYAASNGITVLSYGALCRGLLSGRIDTGTTFQGDDLRRYDPKFQPDTLPRYVAAVRELDELARDTWGKSVLALAVRWVLDRGPTIALWGARHPKQLDVAGEVDGWTIDDASMRRIDEILQRHVPHPIGPEFMAPPVKRPVA